MAGYERLKARGTVGFKRNVRTNGYMAVMTQGQKDALQSAKLDRYLSEVERANARKPRKLTLIRVRLKVWE